MTKTLKLLIIVFSFLIFLLLGGLYMYLKILPNINQKVVETTELNNPTVQDVVVTEDLTESDIRSIAMTSEDSKSTNLFDLSTGVIGATVYRVKSGESTYMYVAADLPELEGSDMYEFNFAGDTLGNLVSGGHFYLDADLSEVYNLIYVIDGDIPSETFEVYKKAINEDGTLSDGNLILKGGF